MPSRIAIIGCEKIRQRDLCSIGDAKCLVALMKKEGEFSRYKDKDVSIVGIIGCGGCHGERAPAGLGVLKLHLSALDQTVDTVYLGTCITKLCRHKEELINLVKEKAGVEVIEGTHNYVAPKVFP
jgi:predicted metal-binding protein